MNLIKITAITWFIGICVLCCIVAAAKGNWDALAGGVIATAFVIWFGWDIED